jgi:multidrug efflux pump subunit AcrB
MIARCAAIASATLLACGGVAAPEPGGTVRIEAAYAGADVETNEQAVLTVLERAASAVDGVVGTRGVATADGVSLDVRFRRGVDRDVAHAAVAGAVQGALAQLPAGVTSPMITAGRPARWVYARVAAGESQRLRGVILSAPGVVRVDLCGERRPTAAIELVGDRLLARGLTTGEVVLALERANLFVPAGRVGAGSAAGAVRTAGALSSLADVAELVVDGQGARVQDVAAVSLADAPTCRVAGTADTIVRVGLRGHGDELARVHDELVRRLAVGGARPLRPPISFGVGETARPLDDRGQVAARWAEGLDGGLALSPDHGNRVLLLWPGRDPASRDTARQALDASARIPGVPVRWALTASPLVEATIVGDDVDALVAQGRAAAAAVAASAGIAAAGCESCARSAVTRVELDRPRMARLGVAAADVGGALRLLRPQLVTNLIDGNLIIDVTVRAAGGVAAWGNLPVARGSAGLVRLADIAVLRVEDGAAEIVHVDGRRAITVWAQGAPGVPSGKVRAALARALPGAIIGAVDLRALEAASWRSP